MARPVDVLASHRRARAVGFTLIELLVVITMIVLLIGLLIGGAAALLERSKSSAEKTRVLDPLAAAAAEYKITTGNPVTLVDTPAGNEDLFVEAVDNAVSGFDDVYEPDDDSGTNPDPLRHHKSSHSIRWFLVSAQLVSQQAEEQIRKIDDLRFDYQRDISTDRLVIVNVRDAWDTPIRYALTSGKLSDSNSIAMLSLENGLPMRKAGGQPVPYFASAGPDGRWGVINPATNEPATVDDDSNDYNGNGLPDADENDDGVPDAFDNVYSFNIN